MLSVLCLCILASSSIPRYDFGRRTPHLWGGSVTLCHGPLISEMEPSVKMSAGSRASAHPRNLIRWHPCRSSDRRHRLEDTALPRSATRRMKERQSGKWCRRKRVWMSRTNESIEYRTSPIYRGPLWNCPDSIWLNSRNRPLEPLYVQLTGVYAR
jgi:hypothetical protein